MIILTIRMIILIIVTHQDDHPNGLSNARLEGRIWPRCVVPPFSDVARGTPELWNKVQQPLYWSKRTSCCFPWTDRAPDVAKVRCHLMEI